MIALIFHDGPHDGATPRRLLVALVALLAWLTPTAAAAAKPTAVVSLGDSAISGESAGSYEPGTDQRGNYCHRSLNALIYKTTIPGIDARLNLACSGAKSSNLYIGGDPQNGEPPQSDKLRAAARHYEVKMVIVEVGANDDPDFAGVASECVIRFVLRLPGCRHRIGADWQRRLAGMQPKVGRALGDVATVMRQEGYAEGSYQLIAASYWSPLPRPPSRYAGPARKTLEGCPIYDADMGWARDAAVPQLSAALRAVAGASGARFIDFGDSMDGREICARGIDHSQEWTTGLKYDPRSSCPYCWDAVRQSFHANARGHAQLGRCVTEFYAQSGREGTCRRGADGELHALPIG